MRGAPLVVLGGILLALAGCPSRLGVERRGVEECPGGVCAVPTAPARPVPTRTVSVRIVAEDIPVDRYGMDPIGMTHSWQVLGREWPYKITLDPILNGDDDWCRLVVVHELGHVLGLDHYVGSTGWMSPMSGRDDPLPPGPSPAELLEAHRTSRGLRVVLTLDASLSLTMREATKWAARAWNKALEREAVHVGGE